MCWSRLEGAKDNDSRRVRIPSINITILKVAKGSEQPRTKAFLSSLRGTLTTLSNLNIPTISAVSSVALGGGLELALATSFRIFASHALVGLPETRLAIIPGAGGTYRLGNLIGKARALELILTGRRISGDEARELGLCERVVTIPGGTKDTKVSGDSVIKTAIEMARQICQGSPGAVRAAMRAVRGKSVVIESEAYDDVLGFEDRDEALRAFTERREPHFTGRRKGGKA